MSEYLDELERMTGYADRLMGGLTGAPRTPEQGEQQSPEWMASRAGWCTGSRFADVLDFTKAGKEGSKRRLYRLETIITRITGRPVDHYVSPAMEWGVENEPYARIAYEAATGTLVDEVGFMRHPEIDFCGGSVDGLVGTDGIIEIKCPNSTTHVTTLLGGMNADHQPQIQGYLWITGRHWADFISFDPRMPEGLKLYVQRIEQDEAYIDRLAEAVMKFLDEVSDGVDRLKAIASQVPA